MFDFKVGIFSCRKRSLTVFNVRFFMKRAVLNRVMHAIYESKGNAAFQYTFESSVRNTVVENEEYKKIFKRGRDDVRGATHFIVVRCETVTL